MQWRGAVDGWSGHVGRCRAPATAGTYLKHVRMLAAAMGETSPWSVSSGQLEAWLRQQNWSRSSRAKMLVSRRAFYAWAMDEDLCSRSPLAGITVDHRQPGPAPVSPRVVAWAVAIADYLTWLRALAGGVRGRSAYAAHTCSDSRSCTPTLGRSPATTWRCGWPAQIWHRSRRSMRCTVASFYRWAVLAERTSINPAATLQPVKLPRKLPRPITHDALTRALSDGGDRQRLILMLAAVAGLRRAEIAAVHFRDIVGEQLLVRGKGGHHRLIPLHPKLLAELDAERLRRISGRSGSGWSGPYVHPEGHLFPSALTPTHLTAEWVGTIAQGCLPPGWTLHTLRHRFASHAYAAQRDLRAVQNSKVTRSQRRRPGMPRCRTGPGSRPCSAPACEPNPNSPRRNDPATAPVRPRGRVGSSSCCADETADLVDRRSAADARWLLRQRQSEPRSFSDGGAYPECLER